jgi:hypothetical protein
VTRDFRHFEELVTLPYRQWQFPPVTSLREAMPLRAPPADPRRAPSEGCPLLAELLGENEPIVKKEFIPMRDVI